MSNVNEENKMSEPSLESLKTSPYMKLMGYVVSRVGVGFTKEEAVHGADVTEEDFESFKNILYGSTPDDDGKYPIAIDAIPAYIQYREFQEAQISAQDAKKEARLATKIAVGGILAAVAAIVVSIILAFIPIWFEHPVEVKLKDDQTNQLASISKSLETGGTRLDSVKTQVENISAELQKMNNMEIEESKNRWLHSSKKARHHASDRR